MRLYLSKFRISVYDGISPSLLATMSLSSGIGGNTNQEMVDSLVKSNIISNAKLISAVKSVDRGRFINDQNPYLNKPYRISGKENMTDIFTHSVILQSICENLVDGSKVLDIGTGHGYLAFILNKLNPNTEILGLDSNEKAIEKCKFLKEHFSSDSNFQLNDIDEFFSTNQNLKWNIIIGGFYVSEILQSKLIQRLSESKGIGIWPSDHKDGQALYKYTKQNNEVKKQYIMSTLFSQPVPKTKVSKYFLQNEQVEEQSQHKQVENIVNEDKLKRQKEVEEQLRKQLKVLIQKHSKSKGGKLSLSQMRQIVEIRDVLEKLNKKGKV